MELKLAAGKGFSNADQGGLRRPSITHLMDNGYMGRRMHDKVPSLFRHGSLLEDVGSGSPAVTDVGEVECRTVQSLRRRAGGIRLFERENLQGILPIPYNVGAGPA